MRIATVSMHAGPATEHEGRSIHVAALARALAARGADVVVHTRAAAPRLPRRAELAQGLAVDHVPAGPARPLPDEQVLSHMGRFVRELLAAWRADRPDVVHAHSWISGWAALSAAQTLGIPVVLTYHSLGAVARRNQPTRKDGPAQRLAVESFLARGVDRILATSGDEVSELLRLGVNRRKVSVVPSGVDLDRFRPDGPAERRTPGVRRAVVVGRPAETAGTGDVIAALAAVPGTELVVAGGPPAARLGSDPDVLRLRAVAARAGVGGRVVFRGAVPHDELPALLRSADVVVRVPWYESSGLVAVEAMASGVPVVASTVGALVDTVVDGHTGRLVPPRDPGRVATVLRQLFSDELERAGYGFASQDRARARYGWDRIADETLAAYERVAAPEVVLL